MAQHRYTGSSELRRLYMSEKSVCDLEDQLDGAQVSILNKDELITKQTKEIALCQQTVENNIPTEDENNEQLAPVQDLQERETSLVYQNENHKLLQCERKENEHLLGDIYTLRVNETNLYKEIKSLTNEMRHLEGLRERNEGEIHRLREEVRTLKLQLDDAEDVLRDRDEKTRELTHVKSLMDKEKVEVQQLMEALRDRQEQDELVRADLTRLESLREKDAKANEDLKAAMEELQSKHDDALLLVSSSDEIAAKQRRIIDDLNHFIAHRVLGR